MVFKLCFGIFMLTYLKIGMSQTSTDMNKSSPLIIVPERGNMLGGTLVNISGPAFTNKVRLLFDNIIISCTYVNKSLAKCVTPTVFTSGSVKVSYYEQQSQTTFYGAFYMENPLNSVEDVWLDENFLDPNVNSLNVNWNTSYFPNTWEWKIQIQLYGYREFANTTDFRMLQVLNSRTNNDGVESFYSSNFQVTPQDFRVGVLQVTYDGVQNPVLWSRPIPLLWMLKKKWSSYSSWNSYYCSEWSLQDKVMGNFTAGLTACPCTLDEAKNQPDKYMVDIQCGRWYDSNCYGNNNKVTACMISKYPTAAGATQQCCYGADGNIITNINDGKVGFPIRSHPFGMKPYNLVGKVPAFSYMENDVVPYLVCCKSQGLIDNACYMYKERRPPSNCLRYPYPI